MPSSYKWYSASMGRFLSQKKKLADAQDKGVPSPLGLYNIIDFVKGHLGVVWFTFYVSLMHQPRKVPLV